MRKNFIIATAGHIDHGKTSLIRSLTGKDCDTHPEEKQRGITIYLGFSHLAIGDDIHCGIVDVPGHKDFIDTMISGINGIDLVLFIVAADEGFMPQTREHLQILDMLGVQSGIVVLTKADLVDEETLLIAIEDIKENTHNTFLENAEIIATSVVTGMGIKEIKSTIQKCLYTTQVEANNCSLLHFLDGSNDIPINSQSNSELRTPNSAFRLYPDRFFSVKGFGSVVTGTVLSGEITKNTTLYTIPHLKEVKIRRLEAYGQETDTISAGQRASLNLTNFDREYFEQRVMLSDKPYHTTSLIDVQLSLFENVPHLNLWTTCEFYTATIQAQTRIHLMDTDKLFAGGQCFAQFHLNKAIPVCFGDKFIIRNSSGTLTLGGGIVIDAFPLHHRRRTQRVKDLLPLRVTGSLADLICSEVEKTTKPISMEQLSEKLRVNLPANIRHVNLSFSYCQKDNWFWLRSEQDKLANKIVRYIGVGHKNNPLDLLGKPFEELVSLISDFPEASRPLIVRNALDDLLAKKLIEERENTYALTTHKVNLTQKEYAQINWVDQFIVNQKMKVPLWSELSERSKSRDIDEKRLKQILFYLVGRGRIVHYDSSYLHSSIVNAIREKLLNYLIAHPEGITVAQFRDLVNGNRKICLILINIFDREGITTRIDDYRYITEKGRRLIEKD